MSRPAFLCLALAVSLSLVAPSAGQEREPKLLGIKASAWVAKLEKSKDVKERRRAAVAVGLIGTRKSALVIPALTRALQKDDDAEVLRSAARGLGRNVSDSFALAREEKEDPPDHADSIKALTLRLEKGPGDAVREAAAVGLGDIGADAPSAAVPLGRALKAGHAGTRLAAALALRRFGKEAAAAAPNLADAVADVKGDEGVRANAALALGQVGLSARVGVPALRDAVADPKSPLTVRRACAEALGHLGRDAGAAAAALGTVLSEKGPEKGKAAVEARRSLRRAAVTALDAMGPDARGAVPALVKALGDEDTFVRCLAMHSIAQLGGSLEGQREAAFKALLRNLKDPSLGVILSAVEAFGVLGEPGLGSSAPMVRREIQALHDRDGRPAVHEACKSALKRLGATTKKEK